MTFKVLFSARPSMWPEYKDALAAALKDAGLDFELTNDPSDPETVDYMVYAPAGDAEDMSGFTNVRLIQSLWAGPDKLIANKTLTQPLARMVDEGMVQGMSDYVVGHILRHHLDTPRFENSKPGDWLEAWAPPLAQDRTVGFLGIGALGMACARAAHQHGFKTIGWSRNQKSDQDVTCFSGDAGLQDVLAQSDIFVLLLPHTPETEDLLNAKTLSAMKQGATIINPGRGHLIDDEALLNALNSGQISQATLDVFRIEPLPSDHPYWTHPKVMVTPHVASETRISTAVEVAAENIRRSVTGENVLYLVDRNRSY